jgi:hypothetical protein
MQTPNMEHWEYYLRNESTLVQSHVDILQIEMSEDDLKFIKRLNTNQVKKPDRRHHMVDDTDECRIADPYRCPSKDSYGNRSTDKLFCVQCMGYFQQQVLKQQQQELKQQQPKAAGSKRKAAAAPDDDVTLNATSVYSMSGLAGAQQAPPQVWYSLLSASSLNHILFWSSEASLLRVQVGGLLQMMLGTIARGQGRDAYDAKNVQKVCEFARHRSPRTQLISICQHFSYPCSWWPTRIW